MTFKWSLMAAAALLLVVAAPAQAQWLGTGGPGGIYALIVSADGVLFAGSISDGVWRRNPATKQWESRNGGLMDTDVRTLAADPVAAGTLYAGTDGSINKVGGIFKTTDGGESWTSVSTGLSGQGFDALAIDPSLPSTLYAAGAGVFKSVDGGAHWVAASAGLTNAESGAFALAIDPVATSTLYTSTSGGEFKSTDGAGQWHAINNGLLSLSGTPFSTQEYAIDPTNTSTVYLGSFAPVSFPIGNGVYKTTDGGNSWTRLDGGPPRFVFSVILDPRNPATVYAVGGGGVFRSTDGGDHWITLNAGLLTLEFSFATLAIGHDGTVYLATDENGVLELSSPGEELLSGIIPAAISAPGAAGSLFRTSIQLRNPSDPEAQPAPSPLVGHLIFHPAGVPGSLNDPSIPFSLAPGQVLAIADLLAEIGQAGLGSLDILTTTGAAPVTVTRVFNDTGAAGTYGFTEDTLLVSDALNPGDHGILLAPPDLTEFRWNIGVRTLASGATLLLTVHDSQGNLKRTATRSFGPNVMLQAAADAFIVDDVQPGSPPPLSANDSLTVQVTTGNAFVYGAVVDNHTNDPSFQLARRIQ